jgi:hypothetical protein
MAAFRHARSVVLVKSAVVVGAIAMAPNVALADEGGVSYWVPGFFGSLAAAPLQPGWSVATIYYHTSVTAGGDVAFARQVSRGNLTVPFSGSLDAKLKGDADLGFVIPSYTFATPFLGGQATFAVAVPSGRSTASVDATLTASVGPFGFTRSGSLTESVSGVGDAAPMFNVRWNEGVHNWMTYVATDVPIGAYNPKRLANLGINHTVIDAGGGYTYLNPQTGHEFSAVLGFTYNFKNPTTQYQNGVDMHLDWGASQFLSKQLLVGLVGYVYQQLSCDSGSGDRVGCFESRVISVGPQIGYIVPINQDVQGYLNLKGYKEFAAEHRADGWNIWLTFAISPAAKSAMPQKPMITK